ncbi:dromaiocalcin-1-like isoform X2 [Antennarius striatus]
MLDFIFISFGLLCIIQAVLNVSLRLSQSTSLSCNTTQERFNNQSRETDLQRNQITDLQNTIRNLEKSLGELGPSSQSCPDGWVVIRGRCYFLSRDTTSWQESRRSCQADGADLVVFNSLEEQLGVFRYLIRFAGLEVWIGLRNTTGTFQWVDGSIPDSMSWLDITGLDCVKITISLDKLSAISKAAPCGQRLQWMCEKDPR